MNLRFFALFQLIMPIFTALPLLAQVKEDFSDGELLHNPTWTGDVDKFTVHQYTPDYQLLYLNDTQKGNAALTTPSTLARSTEWQFHFQVNGKALNTGSYARFYLTSHSPDLRGEVKGYFVDLGSQNGLVNLVRQDGNLKDTTILISSQAEMKLSRVSSLRIRITRSDNGRWDFFTDFDNGYVHWGTAHDNTYITSAYLGFCCTYTLTNCQNFAFGYISAGHLEEDHIPEPEEPEPKPEGSSQNDSITINGSFFLESPSFTPNGDGINDEAALSYQLPGKGYKVQLCVYDASGRKVREMPESTLESESSDRSSTPIKWDGKDDNDALSPLGIYILLVEGTHPTLPTIRNKMAVALTR